jgi:hypothetical protein
MVACVSFRPSASCIKRLPTYRTNFLPYSSCDATVLSCTTIRLAIEAISLVIYAIVLPASFSDLEYAGARDYHLSVEGDRSSLDAQSWIEEDTGECPIFVEGVQKEIGTSFSGHISIALVYP